MSEERPMAVLFDWLLQLAHRLKVHDICELPGCWMEQIDDDWIVAVNGHDYDVELQPNDKCMKATVWSFCAMFWHKGLVIGYASPFGGEMMKGAEDLLTRAIQKRLETFDA